MYVPSWSAQQVRRTGYYEEINLLVLRNGLLQDVHCTIPVVGVVTTFVYLYRQQYVAAYDVQCGVSICQHDHTSPLIAGHHSRDMLGRADFRVFVAHLLKHHVVGPGLVRAGDILTELMELLLKRVYATVCASLISTACLAQEADIVFCEYFVRCGQQPGSPHTEEPFASMGRDMRL